MIVLLLLGFVNGQVLNLLLYGNYNVMPIYYTSVLLGSPAVNHTVVFDTGSSDLLLPSINCTVCVGNSTNFWSPRRSRTGRLQPCNRVNCPECVSNFCAFTDTFGGGMAEQCWSAFDTVAIGNLSAKGFRFGAILNISFGLDGDRRQGRLAPRVATRRGVRVRDSFVYPDGIWGAAFSALGQTGQQLYEALRVSTTPALADVFSVCLAPSGIGGALTLGGLSPYAQKRWRYTSILKRDFYRFYMSDMSVLGSSVGVNASVYNEVAAIVDTGTPVVNVPVLAFAALRKKLLDACANKSPPPHWPGICDMPVNQTILDGACVTLTQGQVSLLPIISFTLGATQPDTVHLQYTPDFYMQPSVNCAPTELQLALSAPGDNFTVLGTSLLMKYAVVHDRENMRLGFSLGVNCPNTHQ